MNIEELKCAACSFGADLVGVAPVSRFIEWENTRGVTAIFPQAESVIILGRKIPRGTLCNRNPDSFSHFGFKYVEDQALAKTTYDMTIWLEKYGFEGVPIFGYDAEAASNYDLAVPVSPDKPAPNVYVDLRAAAELCGLGMVGKNGLLLTHEFGPLQRVAMLISDAAFPGDEMKHWDFCENCDACVRACPENAFTGQAHKVGSAEVYNINYNRCADSGCGAAPTDFGRFNTIERINASCSLACLDSLERRGKMVCRFNKNFYSSRKG